jgi:WD40 repeat protein
MMQNRANKQKPVIFLAFANDKEDNARYLRNLPKELDGLRKALAPAVQAGLCEVVERASATIEQMLDTFQDARYKDRIAIFHYGGHADGYQLLLEQLDGSHGVAHGAGLVSFFAKQKGLKLVFFNGCSTQQQTLELVESGISAVVGTSSAISDDIATHLSIRFYGGIAQGLSIDKAWLEAVDYIKIQQGFDKGRGEVNTRGLYRKDKKSEENLPDRLPWDMYYRQGAEIVKDWNLPEAVDNPLFGLPDVSQKFNLPEKPYRFLERYSEPHAEIFFGRSYYIRDLYTRAIDRNAAPILLLYGQSGVGKSSLLDAGVLPRLEQVSKVIYVRRNQEKGLLGTLKDALSVNEESISTTDDQLFIADSNQQNASSVGEDKGELKTSEVKSSYNQSAHYQVVEQLENIVESLQGEARNHLLAGIDELRLQIQRAAQFDTEIDEADTSLKMIWKRKEKEFLQPFIVILDQAEEVFTRPNDSLTDELNDFLAQVHTIFGNPKDKPIGKLILSYRKEYSAEFDESFKRLQIPREGVFLKHLERRDIIEVVEGLTLTPSVKNKYRLNIEPELPVIIADDLLEDKDSPIAPILQILLTKMWNMTEEEELRYFSVKKYQQLKKEGILMNDFFHQQMAHFRAWDDKDETSGLALDILNYHTTLLGTAGSRRIEEIQKNYAHQTEILTPIIKKFQELYLLAGFSRTVTGLAHDTLAPVIQNEYRSSDKEGQRAVRVLENRISDFKENKTLVLDETDLAIVEKGQTGMRDWDEDEKALVEASRQRRKEQMHKRKRNQLVLRSLAVLIGLMLVAGFFFQQQYATEIQAKVKETESALRESEKSKKVAQKAQKEAENQKLEAQTQAKVAEEQKELAKSESERARISALAAVNSALEAQLQKDAALLSSEKAKKEEKKAQEASVNAFFQQEVAENATKEARKNLYWFNAKELGIKSREIQASENIELKSLLALTSYLLVDSAFAKRDRKKFPPLETLDALQNALLQFDTDLEADGELIYGEIKTLARNPVNKQIAYGLKNTLVIADLNDKSDKEFPNLVRKREIILNNGLKSEYIRSMDFSPDGEKIAVSSTNGNVYLIPTSESYALTATSQQGLGKPTFNFKPIYKHQENVLEVDMLNFKKSIWLISTSRDTTLQIWDMSQGKLVAKLKPETIARCFVIVDNQLFAGLRNGSVVAWNLTDLSKPPTKFYQDTQYTFFDLLFLPQKNWLIGGTDKGEILFFDLKKPTLAPIVLKDGKHAGVIYNLALSPDGNWLASAGLDKVLKIWDLRSAQRIESTQQIVPWDIPNKTGQVLALQFDAESKYLLFGDNQKMQICSVEVSVLFNKLRNHLTGKQLSNEQWKFYIKGDLKKPEIQYDNKNK